MRKTYLIENGVLQDSKIFFELQNTESDLAIQPAGKMITDSDEKAFIYLLDENDGYIYLKFPQKVWPLLVETLHSKVNPVLKWGTERIELVGFLDELQSLIYNIEGNYNYGEDFTTAVEKTFAQLLE